MTAWQTGIVRVLNPDGSTSGTGFLVHKDGLIATCSHVLQNCHAQEMGIQRPKQVQVIFSGEKVPLNAEVLDQWWRGCEAEDVAFLLLKDPIPAEVEPIFLGSSSGTVDHPFRSFGYPDTNPEGGLNGKGIITGFTTLNGIKALQLQSPEVTPGFSGAPVLDVKTERVVGMVSDIASIDQYGRQGTTAFAVTSETLREVCGLLELSDICPFPGLEPFSKDQQRYFHGRERVIAEMIETLRGSGLRFLAVVGPSGIGKSSVVRAGLLPVIQKGEVFKDSDNWTILECRPGNDPYDSLAKRGVIANEESLAAAINHYLSENEEIERLILFIDQFEELFTRSPEHTQSRFLTDLESLLRDNHLPVTVIISLRTDFLGYLTRERIWVDTLKNQQVNVPEMEESELRASIVKPVELLGRRYESGLVDDIIEDAKHAEQPLPLLQAALEQLWKQHKDGLLTHEAYKRIGRVEGALSLWANECYADLEPTERILAERILTDLVYVEREEEINLLAMTRRPQRLKELSRSSDEVSQVHIVVSKLADGRLLVTEGDELTPLTQVEIIHDALFQQWSKLKSWIDAKQELIIWRQQLEIRQQLGTQLRGEALREAQVFMRKWGDDLRTDERAYIQQNITRQRWVNIGLGIVGLIIVGLTILFGIYQRDNALQQSHLAGTAQMARDQAVAEKITAQYAMEQEATQKAVAQIANTQISESRDEAERLYRMALARQLASQSNLYINSDPQLSLLLSMHAISSTISVDQFATFEAVASLHNWFTNYSYKHITYGSGHTESINWAAFSKNGDKVATASADKTVRIWDAHTGEQINVLEGHTASVSKAIFFSQGTRLLTIGNDIRIWDVQTGAVLTILEEDPINTNLVLPFDRGERILTNVYDTIHIWDADTGKELDILEGHTGGILSVSLSEDGKFIGTASYDNTACIWDAVSGKLVQTLDGHTAPVYHASFSPDGQYFITASGDHTARIWEVESGNLLAVLEGHSNSVQSAYFDLDGKQVITASQDGTARIWEVGSGREIQVLNNQTTAVTTAYFSPDGKHVVTLNSDQSIKIWDRQSGVILFTIENQTLNREAGYFNNAGNHFVTWGTEDNIAQVWDIDSGKIVFSLGSGHASDVLHVSISPSQDKIVAASADKTARILDARTGELLQVLRGHSGSVQWAVFDSSGDRIVTASEDDTVRIWDAHSGAELNLLEGHTADVVWAAFDKSGRKLFTKSQDNTVGIWDIQSGERIRRLSSGHTQIITHAVFNPEGNKIVTSSKDNTALIWDADTGEELLALVGHTGPVNHAAFSSDGRLVVTASDDGTARIWDADTGEELLILEGHQIPINFASFNQSDTRVVTAGQNHTSIVWDLRTGQSIFTLGPGENYRTMIWASFSPDGRYIFTQDSDDYIQLWDPVSGREIAWRFYSGLAISPDGRSLVTRGVDNTAILEDAFTGDEISTLEGQANRISSASFSPNGNRILTIDNVDHSIYIWDSQTGEQLSILKGHADSIQSATFSQNGERIITTSSDDTVRIWDVRSGQELSTFYKGVSADANWAALSNDQKQIAAPSFNDTVRIWDAGSGKELSVLKGHTDDIISADFHPDGTQIVTGSQDNTARIWDTRTGEDVAVLRGHTAGITSVAFSPDGDSIATASADNTARIWNAETGKALVQLEGHNGNISFVAFSHDGERLITASQDHTARLWNAHSGEFLAILKGHLGEITHADISPNSVFIVTSSADNTVRIWEPEVHLSLISHDSSPFMAVYDRQGKHIASAGGDGIGRIWDAQTGELISMLRGHGNDSTEKADKVINTIAFNSSGDRVVTAGWDGTARVWDVNTGNELLVLPVGSDKLIEAAFDPSGATIATSSGFEVNLWDAVEGNPLYHFALDYGPSHLDFNESGDLIAAAGNTGQVRIWDITTGQEKKILQGGRQVLGYLDFSPDRKHIAAAGFSGMGFLWDIDTGERLATLRGHKARINQIIYDHSGELVATASDDGTARIWDAENGNELVVLRGHSGPVFSIAFSPDGKLVATGGFDGTVRLWLTQTGEIYTVLPESTGIQSPPDWEFDEAENQATSAEPINWVLYVAFDPSGERVVSTNVNGTINIFTIDINSLMGIALSRSTREMTCNEQVLYLDKELSCPSPSETHASP